MGLMDRDPVQLPPRIARLVQKANAATLTREIELAMAEGLNPVTIGIGPGVDVPLLDNELYAAEIAALNRQLVVATIRAEPDGYVVERGRSNFGVYTWAEREPGWTSVPFMSFVRGLRAGDRIALGSTPADSLTFFLPESALVPPPLENTPPGAPRATPQVAARRPVRRGGPPSHESDGSMSFGTPPSMSRGSDRGLQRRTPTPPRHLLPGERRRFQPAFEHAIHHWDYANITMGTATGSVIVMDDPELQGLAVMVRRRVASPQKGYQLVVQDPGPELWLKEHGEAVRYLDRGDRVRLMGGGHRIGMHGYVVELPAPVRPTPRFGPDNPPTLEDVSETLGVPLQRLKDARLVKARYEAFSLAFQPNQPSNATTIVGTGGRVDPGDMSRYRELKACFEAWMQFYGRAI